VSRSFSRIEARLITGPAAFLLAGAIDLVVFTGRWLALRRSGVR
jgi:hypothetical protein